MTKEQSRHNTTIYTIPHFSNINYVTHVCVCVCCVFVSVNVYMRVCIHIILLYVLTCGKNGARIGPVISSSLSRVTRMLTDEPLKFKIISNC